MPALPHASFALIALACGGRQSVLNVHMAMRDKSDRNAAEHRKACIEAEVRSLVEPPQPHHQPAPMWQR